MMLNVDAAKKAVLWANRLALMAALAVCGAAQAGGTRFWREGTARDFRQGTLENIALDEAGTMTLGPDLNRLQGVRSQYVWCIAEGPEGELYFGGGMPGIVYRLGEGGQAEEYYRSSEMHVQSLAVDADGVVYAGTSPRGMIFRITPEKSVTVFHVAEDRYVWNLMFDAQGRLLATTGMAGRVLALNADGEATVLQNLPGDHVLALVADDEGNLYAGTSPNGAVYRISHDGTLRALYEFPEQEARALALDGDRLFVGVASPGGRQAPAGGQREGGQERARQEQPARSGGTVYEMHLPTGRVLRRLAEPVHGAYSLAPAPDGGVFAATGDEGKIYRIGKRDIETTLLASMPERQILAMHLRQDGELALACANPGAAVLGGTGYARGGSYTARIYDAGAVAAWGTLTARALVPPGTDVFFSARSGNSARPDATWSDWSDEIPAQGGGRFGVPPARFLQIRSRMATAEASASPRLSEFAVAYRPVNMPPRITSVAVQPVSPPRQPPARQPQERPQQRSPQGREGGDASPPAAHSAVVRVAWQAEDANDDRLIFQAFFRGVDEKFWKPLGEPSPVPHRTWDTLSVPDGQYVVRVVASDAPSNPVGTDLKGEGFSDVFTIDNTRPAFESAEVVEDEGGNRVLKGVAVDETSPVVGMWLSVDGGEWTPIPSEDGMLDSHREGFRVPLPPLPPGRRSLVVRMRDAAGNVGAGRVLVDVPEEEAPDAPDPEYPELRPAPPPAEVPEEIPPAPPEAPQPEPEPEPEPEPDPDPRVPPDEAEAQAQAPDEEG